MVALVAVAVQDARAPLTVLPAHRLKAGDAGSAASCPLLDGELYHAQWLPVSRLVHVVKIIARTDGRLECAEYRVGRNESHFSHSTFDLTAPEFTAAERTLAALGQHRVPFWTEEDEEADRRSIVVWFERDRRAYYLPRPERRKRRRVSAAYAEAFENAWRSVTEPVMARRAPQGLLL